MFLVNLDVDVAAQSLRYLSDVEPTKPKVAIAVTPDPRAMLTKAADDQSFKRAWVSDGFDHGGVDCGYATEDCNR